MHAYMPPGPPDALQSLIGTKPDLEDTERQETTVRQVSSYVVVTAEDLCYLVLTKETWIWLVYAEPNVIELLPFWPNNSLSVEQ